jgi:hypothetical protein
MFSQISKPGMVGLSTSLFGLKDFNSIVGEPFLESGHRIPREGDQ